MTYDVLRRGVLPRVRLTCPPTKYYQDNIYKQLTHFVRLMRRLECLDAILWVLF